MWKVIPDTQKYIWPLKRIAYTYLHGILEDLAEYDCYSFADCELPVEDTMGDINYVDTTNLKKGVYPCEYHNMPCSLYYWICNQRDPHGLVVLNDDLAAVEYALENYNNNSLSI